MKNMQEIVSNEIKYLSISISKFHNTIIVGIIIALMFSICSIYLWFFREWSYAILFSSFICISSLILIESWHRYKRRKDKFKKRFPEISKALNI